MALCIWPRFVKIDNIFRLYHKFHHWIWKSASGYWLLMYSMFLERLSGVLGREMEAPNELIQYPQRQWKNRIGKSVFLDPSSCVFTTRTPFLTFSTLVTFFLDEKNRRKKKKNIVKKRGHTLVIILNKPVLNEYWFNFLSPNFPDYIWRNKRKIITVIVFGR